MTPVMPTVLWAALRIVRLPFAVVVGLMLLCFWVVMFIIVPQSALEHWRVEMSVPRTIDFLWPPR